MKDPVVLRLLILLSIGLFVNGDVMMNDDDDHELTRNDTIEMISLNVSQYCFVDDNTIRINTTVLLNITDSSADVLLAILATDNTVIFTAPTNGSNCTDDSHDNKLSATLYAIQMIIYSVTVLVAIGNITLHLVVKDLHTVSGILIILLCCSVIIITIISMGTLTNTFVNNITMVCIILFNSILAMLYIYQATKLTILFQFAYLMYHSYKLKYKQEENIKKRVFKYIIFIVGLSSVGYLLPVAIDLIVNGSLYSEMERYCFIDADDFTFLHLMLVYGEFTVFIVLQYVTFAIGLTLYFLVSNNCCMMKSTNFRVTMALVATVGINIALLISLRKARIPFDILIPAVTIGTLAEQVILLVLFLSSNKVLVACRSACAKDMLMKKAAPQSMMTDMTEQQSNVAEQV